MNKITKKEIITIICALVFLLVLYLVLSYVTKSKDESENYATKNYGVNEFIPEYVTENDMARIYLNDYLNIVNSDVNKGYSLVNEEYRNKKFGSVDKFREFILSLNISYEAARYRVYFSEDYKVFEIYDKNNNLYIFKIKGVMQYQVYFDETTVKI